MSINQFFGTRTINIKSTASAGLRPVSRICSLSQIIQNRKASAEEKKSVSIEKEAIGEEIYNKKNHEIAIKQNYETVMCKAVPFYLPSIIRIRATDREGNSIEVTY